MKKIFLLLAGTLIVCLSLVIVQPLSAAVADQNTLWTNNSNDVFNVNLSELTTPTLLPGGYEFGLFEDASLLVGATSKNTTATLTLLSAGMLNSTAHLSQLTNGSWQIVVPDVSDSINLTTNEWGYYYWDGSAYNLTYQYSISGTDGYLLSFSPSVGGIPYISLLHDVNPVPVPTAGILLGTGLLGLVGFRRRVHS